MTRKHYIAIARVIKDSTIKQPSILEGYIDKDDLINDLCKVFKQDNNLFSSDRFVSACDDI